MRRLCECREPVAAKFWQIYHAKFPRHSYECHASVAQWLGNSLAKTSRLSGEKIKLKIRTNVVRHSHKCRATVIRIKMKISYNCGKVVRHSHKCCTTTVVHRGTIARLSQDIFSKLDRNSQVCRINVYSMRRQGESCIYIVNLCRKIVTNYSGTSLKLSHSSEIGA